MTEGQCEVLGALLIVFAVFILGIKFTILETKMKIWEQIIRGITAWIAIFALLLGIYKLITLIIKLIWMT